MSQRVTCPHASNEHKTKVRLKHLLEEALSIVDALALPAEVGARLQEVIDLAEGSPDRDDPVVL